MANSVRMLGVTKKSKISDTDIHEIKQLAKRNDIVQLLSKSIAPSIYGHENIKMAVLLQLMGGMEKNLENGTHIRGLS